jgi:hypothetical protein
MKSRMWQVLSGTMGRIRAGGRRVAVAKRFGGLRGARPLGDERRFFLGWEGVSRARTDIQWTNTIGRHLVQSAYQPLHSIPFQHLNRDPALLVDHHLLSHTFLMFCRCLSETRRSTASSQYFNAPPAAFISSLGTSGESRYTCIVSWDIVDTG